MLSSTKPNSQKQKIDKTNSNQEKSRDQSLYKVDPDLFICPLTQEYIRHPVRAGRRNFELTVFLNYVKKFGFICPVNKTPITTLQYDYLTANSLDLNKNLERYKLSPTYTDADQKQDLAELEALFIRHQNTESRVMRQSALTGSAVGCVTLLLYLSSYTNDAAYAPYFTIATTLLDYTIREFSHHKFGLFGGLKNLASDIKNSFAAYREEDTEFVARMAVSLVRGQNN